MISIIHKMHCTKYQWPSAMPSKIIIQYLSYFLAKEIVIALDGVILNPWRASLAVPACTSFSNSTKVISDLPGTRRTSLKPGNLKKKKNPV